MISCRRATLWLQLYTDGRLDASHLPALEAHLQACAACRADFAALDLIVQVAAERVVAPTPPGLAQLIMARIAAFEARRRSTSRPFGLRWGDALLAALLATISTFLFVLFTPSLRASLPLAFAHAFPDVVSLLLAPGPGSIAWIAWVAWIATGLGLTLWLAGAEARSAWRRTVAHSLAQIPQMRQMRQLW
jgi:anti-sigma factor RsiW